MRTSVITALAFLAGCNEYNLSTDPKAPIDDDDTGTPMQPLDQPDIDVDPLILDFGFVAKACPTDKVDVVVSNVGLQDLDVQAVELVGSDAGNYRIHDGDPILLAPAESFVFQVDFMATDFTTFDQAIVSVQSNDPDEPEVDVDLLGVGADEAIIEEIFEQSIADASDILWVIDNSGSMGDEITALSNNFATFINKFVSLGLDYQIGVVTTDMDDPAQSGKLQGPIIDMTTSDPIAAFEAQTALGTSGSGDERGLDAAYAALTSPLITNENAGLLRTDSNVSIIVVSDEEDSSSIDPTTFSNWLDTLQGDPALSSFSGVTGPRKKGLIPVPCISFTSGASAEPTARYPKVMDATGGQHISICKANWASNLGFLAYAAAGLRLSFPLTYAVTDESLIEVEIDGVAVPFDATNGWVYDDVTNSIVFNGTSIPSEGAEITVNYPMETECLP
jgi:hypothetical protein